MTARTDVLPTYPEQVIWTKKPRRCANSPGRGRYPVRGIDVAKATCSVEGCPRAVRAGGKCIIHHEPRKGFVPCPTDGCSRPVRTGGLCTACHRRRLRHGDPLSGGAPRYRGRTCTYDGCDSPHEALGFCQMHYIRLRLTGTTEEGWRPGQQRKPPSGEPWNKGAAPWCVCQKCGKAFQVRRCRAATRRFCSNKCRADAFTGKGHPRWSGGVTSGSQRDRKTYLYAKWRRAVKVRDSYACVFCGRRGGVLHADHILSWSKHPEYRFDIDNGRTLCVPCHKTTESWGRG